MVAIKKKIIIIICGKLVSVISSSMSMWKTTFSDMEQTSTWGKSPFAGEFFKVIHFHLYCLATSTVHHTKGYKQGLYT